MIGLVGSNVYGRARAAGIPARSALAIARQWTEARGVDVWPGSPVELEPRDGYRVRVRMEYDEGTTLADIGYGTFLDGREDYRTGYTRRPDPDAVPNPHRDSRNPSGGAPWYLPGDGGTLRERAAEYRRAGVARGPAWDRARESIADELRTVTWDSGPSVYVVIVDAIRAGVVLGTASLGGVVLGYDPITGGNGSEYVAELLTDMIPEALDDARATVAAIVG